MSSDSQKRTVFTVKRDGFTTKCEYTYAGLVKLSGAFPADGWVEFWSEHGQPLMALDMDGKLLADIPGCREYFGESG